MKPSLDLQLDALNSCLFTYNTVIKTPLYVSSINTAHHQEVHIIIVYVQPLVLSLSLQVTVLCTC
jgi:hypothetical protein